MCYIEYYMYPSSCHFEYVSIHPNYRNKGYCQQMVGDFIEEMRKKSVQGFTLNNAGGELSCKCYVKAFRTRGYVGVIDGSDKTISCTGDDVNKKFRFTKSKSGGRRSSLSQRHRNMTYVRFPTAKHQSHAALPLHRRTGHRCRSSRCRRQAIRVGRQRSARRKAPRQHAVRSTRHCV